MARRWSYDIREYVDYDLPKKASLFEVDMDTIVQCASCGKFLPFGECYTSKVIHSISGFGYGVCDVCHTEELDEYLDEKNRR